MAFHVYRGWQPVVALTQTKASRHPKEFLCRIVRARILPMTKLICCKKTTLWISCLFLDFFPNCFLPTLPALNAAPHVRVVQYMFIDCDFNSHYYCTYIMTYMQG